MGDQTFPREQRLSRRTRFEAVLNQGRKRRVGRVCTLFFLPNDLNRTRLGIIASRKVGKAVIRNRAKRRIREIFRLNKERFSAGTDVVVISSKYLPHVPFKELERQILSHLPRP